MRALKRKLYRIKIYFLSNSVEERKEQTLHCGLNRNACRVKMDKRAWPNLIYGVILFVVCVTVWQIIDEPEPRTVPTYTLYTSNVSVYSHPVHTLPVDDYHQLIDLHNFTFLMLTLPCNESSPLLLVLIHSNPKNFDIRRTVRETWGQNTNRVKVVFMMGVVRNATLKKEVERESEEFGDLVQGSFFDAYRNMTYKHVMLFKYAIYHCPQARYVLKTDDDVFVNMPQMLHFLTYDLSPFGGSRMIFCILRKSKRKTLVLRSYRSKWRVSFKEYAGKKYPPHCPGWAVLYSPDVVFDLYREAQKVPPFWIDDVHITGTLADKIHLNHVNVAKVVLNAAKVKPLLQRQFNQSFLYGPYDVANEDIKDLWEYVQSQDVRVSLLKDLF